MTRTIVTLSSAMSCSAVAMALALALLPAPAMARNFRCDEVWKNASSSNDASQCFTDADHLIKTFTGPDQIGLTILAVLPLLFFLIGFFCCPFVVMGRYCCKCCGSYRRRPTTCCCGGSEWDEATPQEKEAAYPRESVTRTKIAAVVVFVLATGALILSVNGTSTMNSSYANVFTQVKSILSYVNVQAVGIRTLLTINATGQLVPPLSNAFFDNITNKINDFNNQIDTGKKQADPYVEQLNIAALVIGIVPLFFLLLTVVCAVLDIRTCIPCLNVCCHYLFFIPYAILGFVFLLMGLLFGNVCGERDTFLAGKPGLISLAGVPLCAANVPFATIENDITSLISEQALSACNTFLTFCSASQSTYSLSKPQIMFSCPGLTNPKTQCVNFIQAAAFGSGMSLFSNAPVQCRNGTTTISPCNLQSCGSYCTDATLKNSTNQAATYLGYASNGNLAFVQYVAPLLSCTKLYSVALAPLTVCDEFVMSVYLIGGSFFGYTIFFLAGLVVLWRGQKRFFKLPPLEEEPSSDDQPSDEDAPNEPFTDLSKAPSPDRAA